MSTSLHFFFPPVYKKSPSEGTRIRGSTLFCLRSPARPHEVLSYSVRCKGRRPGDLLSFRPSRSGMQFSHLICIRFHYPDSLCHIQKTYSFLHRSYYRQELMFNAVSVKLMECRSGNSDEKQAACDSPCQVVDFSGYHFSPSNSEMHFSFLSISALTIRTRFAVFRRLLFSSSFRCVYFTTIRNACQQDFCKIFVYLKIQWPASILSICFSSTS